jgi:hypothetical protein
VRSAWSLVAVRIVAAAVAVLACLACDNGVSSGGDIRIVDLPDAVGTTWTYEVTSERKFISYAEFMDSVPEPCRDLDTTTRFGLDTITVSVIDTVTVDVIGRMATVWDISKALDTLGFYYRRLWLVVYAGPPAEVDTLVFHSNADASAAAFYFLSPLAHGQEWQCIACDLLGYFDMQRYTAEYVPGLETPAARFTRLLKISYTYSVGDEAGGLVEYWLAPRVGIVKRSQYLSAGGSPCGEHLTNMTWELLEYRPPTRDRN